MFSVIKHYQAETYMPSGQGIALEDVLDEAVQAVMKKSLVNKSEDNITVILVFFKNFLDYLKKTLKASPVN